VTTTGARTPYGDAVSTFADVVIVLNPAKNGLDEFHDAVDAAWPDGDRPTVLETTEDDPGVGQGREALERGARVVVAAGGDGTVRAVAEALAGTDTAMGIVPLGTGNLLARNLGIPIDDVKHALAIVQDGVAQAIDVGRMRVQLYESDVDDEVTEAARPEPTDSDVPADHIFLVIAGMGFDALVVGDADPGLKAKAGWMGYVVAGAKNLSGRRLHLDLSIDEGTSEAVRTRMLLFCNCAELPGGLVLAPETVPDDGLLDALLVDTRRGMRGWTSAASQMVRSVLRDKPKRFDGNAVVRQWACRTLHVSVPGGAPAEVDGDVIGTVREAEVRVDPGALTVLVPRVRLKV